MIRRSLALALLAAAFGCSSLASSPDRARAVLGKLGRTGVTIPLAGGRTLEIPPGKLEAMAVDAGPGDRRAFDAFGQLSLAGRIDGIPVSYVGNERFRIECGGSCRVEGPVAPRLAAVVEALLARRDALAAGDVAALSALAAKEPRIDPDALRVAADREVAGWFIRVEGDEAVVGEAAPDGKQKRIQLARVGEAWRFSSGLP